MSWLEEVTRRIVNMGDGSGGRRRQGRTTVLRRISLENTGEWASKSSK